MADRICNLCGSTRWKDMKKRVGVRCKECNSLERTRALKLVLEHYQLPVPGSNILHFAPEEGLSAWLEEASPNGYDPVDFDPARYPHTHARKFDLTCDVEELPSNHYDLILHCHVLEHVPCDLAYVIFHLTRALKPDGFHVFSVPIRAGYYDEYLGPMDAPTAVKRFGQWDHVRSFGLQDMDRHLGKIINLGGDYSLYRYCDEHTLDRYNIPPPDREGLNSSTIFVTRKQDYMLQG